MTIEALGENEQQRTRYKAVMVSSGATNTALVEDEQCAFVHGGRPAEAFDFGDENILVVCIGNVGSLKETQLVDWLPCVGRPNRFEHITFPFLSHHPMGWQAVANLSPPKSLSCLNVEESGNVYNVSETVSFSAGLTQEVEVEAVSRRGTYCIEHTEKILFSQTVEIKLSELPRWKPRVIIDRNTP